MNLGERLKEERVRLGYSQTEFAALADAKKHAQIKWEKGETYPNAAALAAWHAAGVDVLYVLTGARSAQTGNMPAPIGANEPVEVYAQTREEAALLDNYRNSPPEGQAALQAASAALAKPHRVTDKKERRA